MRCSFSEAHLDEYVDGTLDARDRARVAQHLADCPACTALLEEFRVIDALLLTPRSLEPLPNFTFKVMAEVRALPQPRAHHLPTLAVLGTYVVFAWTAIGAMLVFARPAALAMLATLRDGFVAASAAVLALANATEHVFGHQSLEVTTAMARLLALDVVAATLVFGWYGFVRARRTARASEGEGC
jgi:anti-sigma factor RsiW